MCRASEVIKECCNSTDASKQLQVKTLLHYFGHGHLSLHSLKALSVGMSAEVICTEHELDYTHSLSGVLFYILESFLPMMAKCCQKLKQHNEPNPGASKNNKIHMQELEVVAEGVAVRFT